MKPRNKRKFRNVARIASVPLMILPLVSLRPMKTEIKLPPTPILREHLLEDIICKQEQNEEAENLYLTGELEGEQVYNHFADYTGIRGKVPLVAEIFFENQLDSLWERKLERSDGDAEVRQVYDDQVKSYDVAGAERMSLDDYLGEISASLSDINSNLDWELVGIYTRLDDSEQELLRKISTQVDERCLLSYAMTEIMGSYSGRLNKKVFEFLLNNAGREYIELIPAQYDSLCSYGPYQLTHYAVYVSKDKTGGASLINWALPEEHMIPHSITQIEGNNHHKAAYLNSIYNIALLLRNLNGHEQSVLENRMDGLDAIMYIAGAHHSPVRAINAVKRWLRTDSTLEDSFDSVLREYCRKTAANYSMIKK